MMLKEKTEIQNKPLLWQNGIGYWDPPSQSELWWAFTVRDLLFTHESLLSRTRDSQFTFSWWQAMEEGLSEIFPVRRQIDVTYFLPLYLIRTLTSGSVLSLSVSITNVPCYHEARIRAWL